MEAIVVKNMGTGDRVTRIVVAIAIGALLVAGRISGIAAIALLIIAAVLLITGLVARCPGYVPFGINTAPSAQDLTVR